MDEIVGRNCRFLVDPAPWSQSLDPQWPHKMGGKTMPVAPPPSHHIFLAGMSGMFTIPSHGWFMALFYLHNTL